MKMKKPIEFLFLEKNLSLLPTPSILKYSWNFGSMLGFMLSFQVISGILLSIYYSPSIILAFQNCIFLSKNFKFGFLIKFIHSNGVSFFFVLIYLHIFRGLMNLSFKNIKLWNSGILILLLLMMISFLGYVLPWGQMSLWGATVICNVLSSIPMFGSNIVIFLWGDFVVSQPTLNRFFTFHFSLPFILIFFSLIHLAILHEKGSSNNMMIFSNLDKIVFKKNFILKDMITILILILFLNLICNSNPMILLDSENFNPANFMVTPIHIMPEWYFLFAYAMLRSIPNKLGGVIILIMSIFSLFFMNFIKKKCSSKFSIKNKIICFMKMDLFILLTFLGMKQIEEPFLSMGIIFTILYFPIMLI